MVWKYPSDDFMSFFGELESLYNSGELPSHFIQDLKNSPDFHLDSRFTYNPIFLHRQPQSLGIPRKICVVLPAGLAGTIFSLSITQYD